MLRTSQEIADSIIAQPIARPLTDLNDLEIAIPGLDRALLRPKRRMICFQWNILTLSQGEIRLERPAPRAVHDGPINAAASYITY